MVYGPFYGVGFKTMRKTLRSSLAFRVAPLVAFFRNPGVEFKNNYFTEMCSGSEAGSYLRRIDCCITQL